MEQRWRARGGTHASVWCRHRLRQHPRRGRKDRSDRRAALEPPPRTLCKFDGRALLTMDEKTVTPAYPSFGSDALDELSEEETTLIIGLCVLIIVIFIILVGSAILCMSLRRGETFLWESAEREARASKHSSLDHIP